MSKKNVICSADGLIEVPYGEVTHACMCLSIYSLMQYLMLVDEEVARHHTAYFLGYAVKSDMADRLPAFHFATKQTIGQINTPSRWRDKIVLRLSRNCRYPFLRRCKIYAQDMGIMTPLIGNSTYGLLSDGPYFLSQDMQPNSAEYLSQQRKGRSLQGLAERVLYGPVSVHNHGNNKLCTDIYLTHPNESPVLEGRRVHLDSLESLWEKASESKRDFILHVFDVSKEEVALLSSRSVMFMTQPLTTDNILTTEEYVELMKRILSHYDPRTVIFKKHPRDTFNYSQYFPECMEFSKPVNMQLLNLLGVKVERAATIFSSSVSSFPEEVEVDWFGTKCHPKILAAYGDTQVMDRPHNEMTL